MRILRPVSKQAAVMHIDPVSGRLGANVPGFGLCIQEEAVIGGNDDVMEAGPFELVDGTAEPLQGVVNQAECGIGIAGYNDIKISDVIEVYALEKVQAASV